MFRVELQLATATLRRRLAKLEQLLVPTKQFNLRDLILYPGQPMYVSPELAKWMRPERLANLLIRRLCPRCDDSGCPGLRWNDHPSQVNSHAEQPTTDDPSAASSEAGMVEVEFDLNHAPWIAKAFTPDEDYARTKDYLEWASKQPDFQGIAIRFPDGQFISGVIQVNYKADVKTPVEVLQECLKPKR